MPRDADALGYVRDDAIRTSWHATLYDSDKSATAGCDENANTDDRVLKPPIKMPSLVCKSAEATRRQRLETKLFAGLAFGLD